MSLASSLIGGFEQLVRDVGAERFGDPHVAFVVLVSPNDPPRIAVISDANSGCHDLGKTKTRTADDPQPRTQARFWSVADLEDAARALDAARMALHMAPYAARRGTKQPLGEQITEEIGRSWENHRRFQMEATMKKAADEAARPNLCGKCKRRFTDRGWKQHLARSRYCADAEMAS